MFQFFPGDLGLTPQPCTAVGISTKEALVITAFLPHGGGNRSLLRCFRLMKVIKHLITFLT